MRILYWLSFFLLVITVSSCNKDTVNIIEDNTAPPYNGVTTVEVQNYVNRVYIDLLGREPLESELEQATTDLKNGNLETPARINLVEEVQDEPEYESRFHETHFKSLLNGLEEDMIGLYIILFEQQYDQLIMDGNILFANLVELEIGKLEQLETAEADLFSGQIDINGYMRRLVNNFFYDEINMGSENFAISCFENFFNRLPTDSELASSVTMIDGFSAQLLLSDGSSKAEFLSIITSHAEFHEGIIRDMFNQLLSREANSIEMGTMTEELMTGNATIADLQKQILITSEYAGF